MTIPRSWGLNDLRGPAPTALVFGRGRPVEVHQVALVELQLLGRESGLGSQRAFQSELGCFLNHGTNCNLAHSEVVTRVSRDSARGIVELRLARGLELRESWRAPAVQRPIRRVASDLEEAVLGEEALGQNNISSGIGMPSSAS